MKRILAILSSVLVAVISMVASPTVALANDFVSQAPPDAEAYFIAPKDGDIVPSTFKAQFGLSGMGIAPAGVQKEGTGHHHLLVDLETLPDLDKALSATEHIRHFGSGQTETMLTLPPGEHTLQLLLANYVHIPHQPPVMSDPITITVE